jgi:hypothetical protein
MSSSRVMSAGWDLLTLHGDFIVCRDGAVPVIRHGWHNAGGCGPVARGGCDGDGAGRHNIGWPGGRPNRGSGHGR